MPDELEMKARIIAHRGLWESIADQNSPGALKRALEQGFGIETDLRDMDGTLVISHDPARLAAPVALSTLEGAFSVASNLAVPIALNIKSDGLMPMVVTMLQNLPGRNIFCFDMSYPQQLTYARHGVPIAVRASEYESPDVAFLSSRGLPMQVWLDCFESDWWLDSPEIDELCMRAAITLVSPELHGRDPEQAWAWAAEKIRSGADVSLCTNLCFQALEVLA